MAESEGFQKSIHPGRYAEQFVTSWRTNFRAMIIAGSRGDGETGEKQDKVFLLLDRLSTQNRWKKLFAEADKILLITMAT